MKKTQISTLMSERQVSCIADETIFGVKYFLMQMTLK